MKRIPMILYVALLFAIQSCIRGDVDDCNPSLRLRFKYTLNNQQTNLFGTNIHKITVYIFDKEGKYVDMFSEWGEKITNDYVMQIPLPEGTYGLVAYGGDFTTYTVGELNSTTNETNSSLRKGTTDIKDFRLLLNNTESAEGFLLPVKVPDDLYVGIATSATSAIGGGQVTDVELIQDTKRIKVILTGTGVPTRTQAVPEVYITALNGRYKFDNQIDGFYRILKYLPVKTTVASNRLEAELKIMRLVMGTSPTLIIKDPATGKLIYSKNIVELILLNPAYASQRDLDREEEFVFAIKLEEQDQQVMVSVTINGWEINEIFPVTE